MSFIGLPSLSANLSCITWNWRCKLFADDLKIFMELSSGWLYQKTKQNTLQNSEGSNCDLWMAQMAEAASTGTLPLALLFLALVWPFLEFVYTVWGGFHLTEGTRNGANKETSHRCGGAHQTPSLSLSLSLAISRMWSRACFTPFWAQQEASRPRAGNAHDFADSLCSVQLTVECCA